MMRLFKNLNIFYWICCFCLLANTACKKEPNPSPIPEPPGNVEEVITTFKIIFTDSISGLTKSYVFTDPDGTGGLAAFYGPTVGTQSDSVIVLNNNSTYSVEVIMLDETKTPVAIVSDEVLEEAQEHMLFFNQDQVAIIKTANPYIIQLQNSCQITYLDLDNNSPQLPLGLKTKWRTFAPQSKSLLNVTLKHQPEEKDGSFAPGDSDISVNFKLEIN